MSDQNQRNEMDSFSDALLDVCEQFRHSEIDVIEAVYVGIAFFTSMAHDCAPEPESASQLINHAVSAGKEASEGCNAETIRH